MKIFSFLEKEKMSSKMIKNRIDTPLYSRWGDFMISRRWNFRKHGLPHYIVKGEFGFSSYMWKTYRLVENGKNSKNKMKK